MSANILNLVAYNVTSLVENDHDYHIEAEVVTYPAHCKNCKSDNIVGFGRRVQMIKDLALHGKCVSIYVNTRRFKCRACAKTFYEPLPEIDEKRMMTARLAEWIGKQSVKRTFTSIAEEIGIAEGTVRLVFHDHVAELERETTFETPKWLSIDEIDLTKPRCVVTNIQKNTIIELLKTRNKETMIKYLSSLSGRDRIEFVAMDMWRPYRDAVELVLPQAKIVIDKFHVVKMANEAIERVRKALREGLTIKQRRGLMHDRFVLLRRESELTDKEALLLSGWLNNYPKLKLAYRLKEDFFKIYDVQTKDEALAKYEAWQKSITFEVHEYFSDLIQTWDNWQPYILNYFDHPITNAYTESLNNLIPIANRIGRGYSFEALRAKILFPVMNRALSTDCIVDKNHGVGISTIIQKIEDGEI